MPPSREPAWWQLALVPALLVGLWLLQERLPLSPGWRAGAQYGVVLFVQALLWLWLLSNAGALSAPDERDAAAGAGFRVTRVTRVRRTMPHATTDPAPALAAEPRHRAPAAPLGFDRARGYGLAFVVAATSTLTSWVLAPFISEADIVMVYVLGVLAAAARLGRGPVLLTSVLSVAAFDLFFVHPYYTFAVSDTRYVVTFAVMLTTALVVSTLTARLQAEVETARDRERRSAALYALSRDLAGTRGVVDLSRAAVRHIAEVVGGSAVVLMPGVAGRLEPAGGDGAATALGEADLAVAEWVHRRGQPAALGRARSSAPGGICLPLAGPRGPVGVLAVTLGGGRPLEETGTLPLLETMANQTALALERALIAEEAERVRLQVETERLRSSLLSSVSHDLRTPLAAIMGAASTILQRGDHLDEPTRDLLSGSIYDEAARLNHLVAGLLDMTRLELGALPVRKEWVALEEVVGSALRRVEGVAAHPVRTDLPADLPLVPCDEVLLEQALINVLENAAKYSPAGGEISVAARLEDGELVVEVADRGPGWPPGEEDLVFEKFHRGARAGRAGFGLGLAIAKAIVEAQGGRIRAEAHAGGGALLRLSVPLGGAPPALAVEAAGVGAPAP